MSHFLREINVKPAPLTSRCRTGNTHWHKAADGDIRFDNEDSGYGVKTERYLPAAATELPTACRMQRPWNLTFSILIARFICYAPKHRSTEICHA